MVFSNPEAHSSPGYRFRDGSKNPNNNNRYLQQNKDALALVKKEKPITISNNINSYSNLNGYNYPNNPHMNNINIGNKNIKNIFKQGNDEKDPNDSNYKQGDRSSSKGLKQINLTDLNNLKHSMMFNNGLDPGKC